MQLYNDTDEIFDLRYKLDLEKTKYENLKKEYENEMKTLWTENEECKSLKSIVEQMHAIEEEKQKIEQNLNH